MINKNKTLTQDKINRTIHKYQTILLKVNLFLFHMITLIKSTIGFLSPL